MQSTHHQQRTNDFESDSDCDSEISLIDILLFLKRAYKTIAITIVLGLVIAGIFLLLTPNQFEALANIAMARSLPTDKNPQGVNIEEPQALINRMSLPTSWDQQVVNGCDLQNASNPAAQLSKVIKLSIPKGVANVVELKVTRPSPEVAKACADNVFEAISASQAKMMEPIKAVNSARARLTQVEARLAQDKTLFKTLLTNTGGGGSKNTVSPTYFALLSETRNLEDEREKLLTTIDVSSAQTATLQSPVYVADQPIYPKKAKSLLAGLFGGLFLGVLIALVRQMIPKLKAQMLKAQMQGQCDVGHDEKSGRSGSGISGRI
ncbi:Wzz/FepE/Etk N-terminal domain-containing protein [Polynucleobacter necessarius]|uniref:Wzz/FepE/Etk N-terminal domain-containing protein n=1 Tax=Polynucleobacter necessarius TaxID=576610 RepID=UPI001E28274C|nr:Wzz/FepE/Etk N-terminal domain-containing protein [Polynucleobacter necessarius]